MSFRRNSKRALQALTEHLPYTECRAIGGLTRGCLKPSAGPSVPDVRLSGPPGSPNEPHTGRGPRILWMHRAFSGCRSPFWAGSPAQHTPAVRVLRGVRTPWLCSLPQLTDSLVPQKSSVPCRHHVEGQAEIPPYFIGRETEVRRVRRGWETAARVFFSFKALRAAGALPTKCQVLIAKPLTGKTI